MLYQEDSTPHLKSIPLETRVYDLEMRLAVLEQQIEGLIQLWTALKAKPQAEAAD